MYLDKSFKKNINQKLKLNQYILSTTLQSSLENPFFIKYCLDLLTEVCMGDQASLEFDLAFGDVLLLKIISQLII